LSLDAIAQAVASSLTVHGSRLATAESCTGGMIASTLTGIAGSSDWFECAFVTYRLSAKTRMLGVSPETLRRFGAVSEPTAREMVVGALKRSDADIAVSVTGVAGPAGGDVLTPVGMVWFAWAVKRDHRTEVVQTECREIDGARNDVRVTATEIALRGVLKAL
jgi:nicotinamide-nucleotide amidase